MLSHLMFTTVDVQRPTYSKGTSGGIKESWSTVYDDKPANVQPVSASWLVQYAQRKIDVSHTVYFDSNPTIQVGDRIVYGSRNLLVKGVRDLIELDRVLAVDCLELQ